MVNIKRVISVLAAVFSVAAALAAGTSYAVAKLAPIRAAAAAAVSVASAEAMVSVPEPKPLTKEELADLYRQTREWKSYRIDFRITFGEGKNAQKLEGRYEMSGTSFHISTPEVELFSDGTTKWEVSRLYKEIAIDVLSGEDRAILANPAQFFDQLGRGVAIEVLSIVPHIIPGPEFRFDAARYPGFEVVDFR